MVCFPVSLAQGRGEFAGMKNYIAALDFGTSKIVTLIVESSTSQKCDVVATGIATYDGFLKEGWNNPAKLDEAIRQSIQEAESQINYKVKNLSVGVPGIFTEAHPTEARVDLKGTQPEVKAEDVKNVFRQAAADLNELPGVVVHTSPAWFLVDEGKQTLEPTGLKGRSLRGLISFVTANQFFVDDVNIRLQNMGYTVTGFYSSAVAEGMLFLPETDRDHMAVLIDVGYLNTDIIIMHGDALLWIDSIDMGGGIMAADLAEQLDIPLSSAEMIKRKFIYGLPSANEDVFSVPAYEAGKTVSVPREKVVEILEGDVAELAEMINQAIASSGARLGNWSNIYLTGGGICMNKGGKETLSSKMEKPVREAPRKTPKLNSHIFSSSLGLVNLIVNTNQQAQMKNPSQRGRIREFIESLKHG